MDTTCTNMLITANGKQINQEFDERMMNGHYSRTNMLIIAIYTQINQQFNERMMYGHYTRTNIVITAIFTQIKLQFGRRMIYGHNLYEYVDYSDLYMNKVVVWAKNDVWTLTLRIC